MIYIMRNQYKVAVWLFDAELVTALRAAAATHQESVSGLVTRAIRQALTAPTAASGDCAQCAKVRARDTARRRANGVPMRKKLPPVVASRSKRSGEKICPVCDTRFVSERRNGREQLYCSRGNRRCMKYAGRANHDIELARRKYAAKAHTFTD
jgi:hypothetical protein